MSEAAFSLLQGDPSDWGLPPSGKTFVGVNESGQFVLVQHDGTITVLEPSGASLNKQANSSGVDIGVTPGSVNHKEVITLTGSARTQTVTVAPTTLSDGAECGIQFVVPATAGIIIEVVSNATVVWRFENTTGYPIKALCVLYKDGAAWFPWSETVPAYTPAT